MDNDIKKYSFKEGIYLGSSLILLISIFYCFDSKNIIPQYNIYSIVFMLILLGFPFFSVYKYPYELSNTVFKSYFSICFLVMSISLLITTIYFYFLYNLIDPSLINQYTEIQYEKCQLHPDCSSSFEEIFEFYKYDYFSISSQLHSYVFSLIPCTLYSSIISLLIKIIK